MDMSIEFKTLKCKAAFKKWKFLKNSADNI